MDEMDRGALNLWTLGSQEREDRQTDRYVEWPGGNMKAKTLFSIQSKYQKSSTARGGDYSACAYLSNTECFTSAQLF